MSELPIHHFLQALVRAGERLRGGDPQDRPVQDALTALHHAAEVLTTYHPEVVLSVADGVLYLGTQVLPHTTTEFDGLVAEMERRGIDSITLTRDAHREDLADLAGVVTGVHGDLPVGGTVRLNERPLAGQDLSPGGMSGLRRTYRASLDALRALGDGGRLEMTRVRDTVEGFVGTSSESSLMMATIRNYDETTYYHSVNVCLLSMSLGRGMGLREAELSDLAVGALLHDLGRVLLGEVALKKEGKLTNEEWAQVRLHPQEGAQAILAAAGQGQEIAATVALEHHARMDGDGYPDLAGRAPHPYSRIVGVVDAYDAITSRRPHRPARTPQEAMKILAEGSGTAFDPAVVTSFLRMMGEYPPGSLFRTRKGEVVVVTGPGSGAGPEGLVVRDPEGRSVTTPQPVLLSDGDVLGPVLAEEAGIDPSALLEAAEA